nr:MAG: ORF1 [TTV-like mini virus]
MPYYRKGYYRRRRFWTRRPRGPFRRRWWRRRRNYRRYYGVRRKRKLPFLKLIQWQPQYIRKLRVSGTLPLYITTNARVANNMTLYKDTIAPHYVPSMGGFSITQITLQALYQQFYKGRAWWTQSTNDFPLIRYLYCNMYLYRAESSDYMITFHNCYPMKASLEAYQATQPSMMLIHPHRHIMRCKKHNYIKKPYKKIKIHPPAQLKNQWFFQKDIANIPLLMWRATTCSFDRVFMASNSVSTTVGIKCLNTKFFQLHNWAKPPTTTGYKPKEGTYLYSYRPTTTTQKFETVTFSQLIYLGNSTDFTLGETLGDKPWDTYITTYSKWGNIFHPAYLTGTAPVLLNTQPLSAFTNKEKTATLKDNNFQTPTENFIAECRYNPFADKNRQNQLYLVSCTDSTAQWHMPVDPKLYTENLPIWLAAWGFIDFQKREGTAQKVELNYVLAFHTSDIEPKDLPAYVPLDKYFLSGTSPYRPTGQLTPGDQQYWHPKLQYQFESYNDICASGPYVIKLPPNVSAEAHVRFSFHFKIGGCAQPEKNIKNPETQPTFPLPNNIITSNSLQSPTTNIENFLYSFDWRRQFLTKKAAQRITSDFSTEISPFESTGDPLNPQTSPQSSQESNSSTEEKEKEALQLLINQHRHRQQQFKRRIFQLLMSNTK